MTLNNMALSHSILIFLSKSCSLTSPSAEERGAKKEKFSSPAAIRIAIHSN